MPEAGPVRFGIVGCGSAAISVCEAIALSSLTELTAVYDVNEDLADDLSRRFNVRKIDSFDEFLADPITDAVYVAVPHYLLAPLTELILQAGKHALTEKPLGTSLEEVDRLIARASELRLNVGVFYEMRYATAFTTARELAQAGAIGDIIGVQIQTLIDKSLTYWESGYTGRSINPWRGIKAQAGGGVVLMNTSHLLDALMYVTGLLVTHVTAEIGNLISNVEVEDMAAATFRFDNGAIGSLIAGAHISGARQGEYFCIYGTKGQIRLPDPYGSDPLQVYLNEDWHDFHAGQWHVIPAKPAPVYQLAIEDFVQALQCGRPAPIDAQAARQVLMIVLSIYQSAAEKKTILIS
ncbi:MAG TPA: Gfo/Idh/MocA family oxidoreductase [Anaerolineales bacterium]|nr:Gfo/Idh/MocA family oxidoreductase [Anaerolineales bacterium]